MNKFDFSEVLMLFQEGIVSFLFRNGITIVVFGDSRIFLKETFKYVKIDKYKTYYNRILLKNSRKAKKQGLVDFPLNRDPLSFFYKIDNDEFIYMKSDMVLVVDNNWL